MESLFTHEYFMKKALKEAEKAFDKPMYTQVPAKVDKSKVFYISITVYQQH